MMLPPYRWLLLAATLNVWLPTYAQFRALDVVKSTTEGVVGLRSPSYVVVSPDNRHVYVAGAGDHSIAVFSRDQTIGLLTFVSVVVDGEAGVDGLLGVQQLAMSTDGRFLYAVAAQSHALSVFARADDGNLSLVQSWQDGEGGANGLRGAKALALSPDGNNLYVAASGDHTVSAFSVDRSSGRLTFVEAVQDGGTEGATELYTANAVVVSPDNRHVYVTGFEDDGVSVFARSVAEQGRLTVVQNLDNWAAYLGFGNVRPTGIISSPDGTGIYVVGYGGSSAGNLTFFARDPTSGELTIRQRFTDDSSLDDRFVRLAQFGRLTSVALHPRQDYVFATGDNSPGGDDFLVLSFSRNPASSALQPFRGIARGPGVLAGINTPRAMAFSSDGHFFYLVSQENALITFSVYLPKITSIAPSKGPPGSVIRISGTDFGNNRPEDTVTIGGASAAVQDWSDTLIIATVPQLADGNAPVTVTVNGYQSVAQNFLVERSSVKVTGFEPQRARSGTLVQINGENFGDRPDSVRVFFVGLEALTVNWLSPGVLTAEVPRTKSTQGTIQVVVAGESGISDQSLVIDNTPPRPSFLPVHQTTDVSSDQKLLVRFDEAITQPGGLPFKEGQALSDVVTLFNLSQNAEVKIEAIYRQEGNEITVNPLLPLEDEQVYAFGLSGGRVADDLGNVLSQDTVIHFASGSPPRLAIQDDAQFVVPTADRIAFTAIMTSPEMVRDIQVSYRGISDYGAWRVDSLTAPPSSSRFTHHPVEISDPIGVEYCYTAVDYLGITHQTDTLYIYRPFPDGVGLPVKSGAQAQDYQLFSVPMELENATTTQVLDELGPYNKERWRLFALDKKSQFEEHPKMLQTGKSYLLLFRADLDQVNPGTGQAVKVTKQQPYKMPVHQGWNLVGNPYNLDVLWEAVVNHPDNQSVFASADKSLFAYGENWDSTQTVLPRYGGGLVNIRVDTVLTIPFGRFDAALPPGSTGRQSAQHHSDGWKVGLAVRQRTGGLRRTRSGFGMHASAQIGWDIRDRASPPSLGRYLDVNFSHPEHRQPHFSRDIVPTQPSYVWNFEVVTNDLSSAITLTWQPNSLPQNEQQLMLWDKIADRVIDMRAVGTYSFSASGNCPFQILYGSQSFVDNRVKPTRVRLSAGYPNPTTGRITLPFAVPATVGATQHTLTIYHISGQRIRILQEGEVLPGFYEASWEGVDATGSRVSPGVYIAELSVGRGAALVKRRTKLVLLR